VRRRRSVMGSASIERSETAASLPHQVAGNAPRVWDCAVFPQINSLPCPEKQAAALNAERHGLRRQSGADVSWHVVIALVVVEVTSALAMAVEGAAAVLWNYGIHPSRQILQHPWISVLVDGEAGAGVETGEVKHAQADARAGNPAVEFFVQAREPLASGGELQLIENLPHNSHSSLHP
jgi:hypothetical protein